ncbi:tryptophan synthase subunit alpha [Thermoflavimicrobium dichotomicum]|uniref:Tryptophan synthase alpha chain n=1 Tax=Thermoflavimicrobium dichotomicum TaxID=46223 RepID=A0A1I3SJE7_9BACL|nr:tryptophan synthase subunit alpha [Thermoflavimicrobium dichotomicum]SFJ58560.1 tryptophan synthase, alpha chain [Thermoflavimicrobium dichotomicum]
MNRLQMAFEHNQPPRLIPFIMTGDPCLEATVDLLLELEKVGVTAIELGVPFSDPTADGPVIQAASERALGQGVTCHDVLQVGKMARQKGCKTPLILFSYLNPLLQYGLEKIVQEASEIGFDGLIVPDLPYEESETLNQQCKQYHLPLIRFVAPTSKQRMKKIAHDAQGFLYCISSLGTTGVRQAFDRRVETFLQEVKELSKIPIAIGFGISKREHVDYFSQFADAVIVGSALVKKIEERSEKLVHPASRPSALQEIITFVKELRK